MKVGESNENEATCTGRSWPERVRGSSNAPGSRSSSTSQLTTVSSSPAEKRNLPSGENATQFTCFSCSLRVNFSFPWLASHILTSPSLLPVARSSASFEKLTDVTLPVCPMRDTSSFLSPTSQIFAVPSALPDANRRPSGEKLTHKIVSE